MGNHELRVSLQFTLIFRQKKCHDFITWFLPLDLFQVVVSYMFLHILLLPECFPTYVTYMWALTCVDGLVILQSIWMAEWRSTNVTGRSSRWILERHFDYNCCMCLNTKLFKGKWICKSIKFWNTDNVTKNLP